MPTSLDTIPRPIDVSKKMAVEREVDKHTAETEGKTREKVEALLKLVRSPEQKTFPEIEKTLRAMVAELGCLLLTLWLCYRERELLGSSEATEDRLGCHSRANYRTIGTWFGWVRYVQEYLLPREGTGKVGRHPLDVAVGLTADKFVPSVLSEACRQATRMSYALAQETIGIFLGCAPCQDMIEQTALGMGALAGEWFEQAPCPDGDGDWLIVIIDGKAVPTATKEELRKRRRAKPDRKRGQSPRKKNQKRRQGWTAKVRKKKGDKKKNGKGTMMVVMYTLRTEQDGSLFGPINKRVYASFGTKRHAFEIAQREAKKRGFEKASEQIQFVSDGDDDLSRLAGEYFPGAIHTLDLPHAMEYIWSGGVSIYKEGSEELAKWAADMKRKLLKSRGAEVVKELRKMYETIPKTGPGNKGRRDRLEKSIRYLDKRLPMMDYKKWIKMDLELGSGAGEGAIGHVIGSRLDKGGMRWIPARAQAILQLRCIEINGDWEAFTDFFYQKLAEQQRVTGARVRAVRDVPIPVPTDALAA